MCCSWLCSKHTLISTSDHLSLTFLRCPQVDVNFHGVAYIITVYTYNSENLCIEVEQKNDASQWRGDFTSACTTCCITVLTLHVAMLL